MKQKVQVFDPFAISTKNQRICKIVTIELGSIALGLLK